VQIVDDHEQRAPLRQARDHGHHGGEEPPTLGLGVGWRTFVQPRQARSKPRQEPRQVRASVAEQRPELCVGHPVEVSPEHPDPRTEGKQLVLVAAPIEDGAPPGASRQLRQQPCLADSAFTGQEQQSSLPLQRAVEPSPEAPQLLPAPDPRRRRGLR